MMNITKLRKQDLKIFAIGDHQKIIQSVLDFDFFSGKTSPSIMGILGIGKHRARYFFGNKEVVLPVYASWDEIPHAMRGRVDLVLNVTSCRRALWETDGAWKTFPRVLGETVFAEQVAESHALQLSKYRGFVIGPSSVGLLIPGILKLGAIGGVEARQMVDSQLFTPGDVAVFSSSGGMTNELIRMVALSGKGVSFALSFGGDRFPAFSPKEALETAILDKQTKTILYFGELGGRDEYILAELLKQKRTKKKVICFIAGMISDMFPEPPQFGHAKAIAKSLDESAKKKREALKKCGAIVPETFEELTRIMARLPGKRIKKKEYTQELEELAKRKRSFLISSLSHDDASGEVSLLGEPLLPFIQNRSLGSVIASIFLGKNRVSKEMEIFTDFVVKLLADHGPYNAGALNTISTARAGRDLVSALASGILTIGPRFGGAINEAAQNWLMGIENHISPANFVDQFANQKKYILGIGHKKYRVDFPDPRVEELLSLVQPFPQKRFVDFARSVEKITTMKSGNLILNVDGAIAAVLLDILYEKEKMDYRTLHRLVEAEFFNAFFILARSIGFIGHFLDQKRLDEGLLRLNSEDVGYASLG